MSGTRIVCDWIQYRNNFRAEVDRRPIVDPRARLTDEFAIDLRRVKHDSLPGQISDSIKGADPEAVMLEPWGPISKSCIWRFNAVYWQELAIWEEAAGHGYAQALPGGESGGTNTKATRASIEELFRVWDSLTERRALPDQLTILEIGVGNGDQAKVWLDEFRKLDAEHDTDYYRRLHYLMGDYSPHVLERARSTVANHADRVSTLVLDASRPHDTLRFLESKIFFVYISNVYDNLPSDEIALLDDRHYMVECHAYLPRADVEAIAHQVGVEPNQVGDLANRLVRVGPGLLTESSSLFTDTAAAANFWRAVWSALRLRERYVPLGPLDLYEVASGFTAEVLAPLIDGFGDLRVHTSNGAIDSFLNTLPLLHPLGSLVSHDLFVTDLAQYGVGFRGPGKYDGSVVNWVNGPLLQATASRRGFSVDFEPFAHGSKSPIVTATARARD